MEGSCIRYEAVEADDAAREITIDPERLTIAYAWVAARQARDRIFDSALFQDPAWDILLDIYIHLASDKDACVTNICVGSSAPATTVLRWIGVLESKGLIERFRDLRDRRKSILRLTDVGFKKMEEALDASAGGNARLGLSQLRARG